MTSNTRERLEQRAIERGEYIAPQPQYRTPTAQTNEVCTHGFDGFFFFNSLHSNYVRLVFITACYYYYYYYFYFYYYFGC